MTIESADQTEQGLLVVIIHGMRGSASKMSEVKELVSSIYPHAEVICPDLPHGSLLSTTRADQIVTMILNCISAKFADQEFENILFIGHSAGAVLARRAIIEASGLPTEWRCEGINSKFTHKVEPEFAETQKCDWSDKAKLLVMMASISRGWSIDNAKSGFQKLGWALGGLVGHIAPKSLTPTIFDFRKGSPFIVQTRLRWLEYCRVKKVDRPKVIQLLGTVDEVVPPNDAIDFATDENGAMFLQVEIPHTGHRSIIQMSPPKMKNERTRSACENRKKLLSAVLAEDQTIYEPYIVPREFMVDELPPAPNTNVNDLVFVVHGIRDRGYWTNKVAARIKSESRHLGKRFVSRTPSYGYFPILPFLLPWYRRQKVEWLMDHYVEAAASYPSANFHFMGHSNGTYLGARALIDYPMVAFKRIMFAGSVVRPDFPWKGLVAVGRVEKIYNAVATKDLVVAVFPNGLRPLKSLFDLGGAGHSGFDETELPDALFQLDYQSGEDSQRKYVRGGHSAARQESQWDEISKFIVHGTPPMAKANNPDFENSQPLYSRLLGFLAPAIVALIAVVIIGAGSFLVSSLLADIIPGLAPQVGTASKGTLWNTWMNQGISTHIVWTAIYIIALRFLALRF